MRDCENQDNDFLIFDPTDETIVADAVAPEACTWPRQRAAQASRIFRAGDPISQKGEDPTLHRSVESA